MIQTLSGKVALVTGATRGIGKGISLQLSEHGAKVYITGRTLKSKDGQLGSLEDTAEEVRKRGGLAVPVQCDHEKPEQVKELFDRINADEKGKLDILVNNAYKGVEPIFNSMRLKFWQQDPKIWDDINNVGLRNHYICTTYAARLMVPRKQGLIVNISSFGGQTYLFNVAYGVGKAALDRMSVDCGVELKKHSVACLSLMLGAVKTELTSKYLDKSAENMTIKTDPNSKQNVSVKKVFEEGESVEFGGKIIAKMATDPSIMSYSAKIVVGSDYALKHGIKDIDGRVIPSHRSFKNLGPFIFPKNLKFLADICPESAKVPQAFIDIANSKVKKV